MKNSLFFCSFLFLIFAGCKKKYTCSYNIQYLSHQVAFVGFTPAELESVIITQYIANTNFNELTKADTIDASGAFMAADTAYASYNSYHHNGFLTINVGIDYKIQIPSTGREFRITNVTDGPAQNTWQQEEHCSPGSSQLRLSPQSVTVSGGLYESGQPETNNIFLYLHR